MKDKVRESLKFSFRDGIFAALMTGVVENYAVALAIALAASASQIANLVALPNLIAGLAQLRAGPLRHWAGSRKKIILMATALQVVSLAAMAALPWFPVHSRISAFMVLLVTYTVLGGVATPMWGSLMCEYLPVSRRSSYFGWRGRLMGGMAMFSALGAGLVLQCSGRQTFYGFFAIFLAAAFARAVSWHFLRAMYEPPEKRLPRPDPDHAPSRDKNFLRFIFSCGIMSFSVSLFGALFPVYLLRELRMSYAAYTGMLLVSQGMMFWMMGRWGRSADRAGNMRIIQVTARCLPLAALLWIFSTNTWYLIVVQLVSGAIWAGYNLCTLNFVFDSVPNRERVQASALLNTVNGVAVFVGAVLGGQLLAVLPPIAGSRFFSLMVLSAAARFATGWFLFPRLREVRQVRATNNRELVFGVMGLLPTSVVPQK